MKGRGSGGGGEAGLQRAREVKLQYRPHKASGNLAGISGGNYLSELSQV